MARRHLGQMACWLKLLAKLAKQRGKHVWSRDKRWVNGKELAKQHFILAIGEVDELRGQGSTNRFPSPGAPAQGRSNR